MNTNTKKAVAYYRVSTKKQGLGLEAQKAVVKAFCEQNGFELIAEYEEKESGKKNESDRPALNQALEVSKTSDATLIVAKLDRLTRDFEFGGRLINQGVKFLACDIPNMNEFNFGIMLTLAHYERKLISERTSKALQALKAKGVKLGSPKGFAEKAQKMGAKANAEKARRENEVAALRAKNLRLQGYSLRRISELLFANGIKTKKGTALKEMQIKRLIDNY